MRDSNCSEKNYFPEPEKPVFADEVTAENFAALRYPPKLRSETLSTLAIDWILYLPATARPKLLGKRYPRIANALAAAWSDPGLFETRLAELMHDNRGTRQGFPPEIASELDSLARYYETVSQQRIKHSGWDSHPALV